MNRLRAVRRNVKAALEGTKVVQAALNGTVTPAVYARYLVNAYHYAGHSPKVMAIAAARCMDDHAELAAYLLKHALEERGHDLWALSDLRSLGVAEDEVKRTDPVPSCSALIGYVHYVAEVADPVGLFGWMWVLEAVGEDLGSAVAAKLKGSLPARVQSRFITGHGVADTVHAHELEEKIEDHVRTDESRASVHRVADVVADLYVRMFREIGEEPTA
jgi:pyrroloquinoline quinone (PQQ) biosynthesis protein C